MIFHGPKYPVALSIIALGITLPLTAQAENLYTLTLDQGPNFSLDSLAANAAPELRALLQTDAALVGMDENGRAVLNFPAEATPDEVIDQVDTLATLNPTPTSVDLDQIESVLVFAEDPNTIQIPEGARLLDVYERGGFAVIGFPNGITAQPIRALVNQVDVAYVESNYPYRMDDVTDANGMPSDTHMSRLWGMTNIHAPAVWKTARNSDLIVAVIDTGVDYNHEDLATWKNPGETPGNNIDDDGNGYVDDVNGWDFQGGDNNPMDGNGHGTHVAGTIGALGGNNKGVVGVAWGAKIMPVKIFSDARESPPPANAEGIAKAIDYAIDNGALILNNSWSGSNFSVAINNAINRARAKGALFVAAASNNNGSDNDDLPRYPASYAQDNIIAVMSIGSNDVTSGFSNVGRRSVDIAAPGGAIISTLPGNNYGNKSGTSMATPHVSGAAALIWSLPAFAGKPYFEIRAAILANARRLPGLQRQCVTEATLDLASFAAPTGTGTAAPTETATPGEEIVIEGTLIAPSFAPGGEGGGITIQTPSGPVTVEVQDSATRKKEDMLKLLEELGGQNVSVKGVLETREFPETGTQQYLIVP